MKSLFTLVQFARGLALAAGAFLAVGLTRAAESAPKVVLDAAVPVHVYVDLPGAIRPGAFGPFNEEDFSRVLGGYVRTEFKKAGYPGEVVVHQRYAEQPKAGQRLDVQVSQWRVDRSRSMECTLTAELTAADGRTANSGIVSETQFESSRSAHGVADALEGVARRSMRELYLRFTPPAPKK